ncbi:MULTISPECIES: AraC family transcriptional regulator [unclassified Pseudomonas]|uniref:AraC family transcriptional regulator n=1 Tax=unclassified Pseudomonas TaxID=196821 RepID=UPI0024468C1D|nr:MULTISPECIES: AraC family transcriptional regulator [unclassified Pseudomonas]MDG9930542.1 AraC family transcriptional regulator [Pseudomonas sp. GD04042]MDH0484845.1 AraC family transcriptional regulator [Pseudomonas sp. GD04015]MDH0605354.1 AraC family transcriptional regulator [Pseudomonas sp. GD03869]MDH0897558.1 AraC family transcriptional regulator [Pseudomonas sp. GD03875]MDH1067344.1 AraC family transcriptional regulator [Pseudomonas sp. GD03985]
MAEVHTIATWALAVSRALEAEGFASAALLGEAGIDPAWLNDSDRRIPVALMSRLWRAARRVSGDDCFGLRVARHCFPTDFHGLLFAIQSSATIAEALQRVVRFSGVVTTSANLELVHQGSRCRLLYRPLPGVQAEQIATEALIACAVRLTRQSWSELDFISAVELVRPAPADPQRWEALLGCPIRFDAPCNAIVYVAQPLGLALRTGNREVASGLDRVMVEYLQRLAQPDLPGRVRDVIVRSLPLGEVQQGAVAEALGMSVRNLHRHLQKHATSFKELLDETRRQLAFDYLRQARCSVNEVCYRLGFNEPSSFNRAFRRWTGETPGQWRRRALQPATRLPGVRREPPRASLELAV